MSRHVLAPLIALALAGLPAASPAQQSPAYSLEQLKILVQGGLPATSILRRVSQDCLAFRLDDEATRQLRAAGATAQLIDGLRGACTRLPEAAAPPPVRTDTVRAPARTDTAKAPVRTDTARAPVRDTARTVTRADTARRQAPPAAPPRPQPQPAAPTAERQFYSPGGAAVKSLILPGLGQFGTKRPAIGAVFMAGAAGALAVAVLSKKTEINCLARTDDGTCPSGQVLDETATRPMLVPGLGAFVALGVVSALEAASGAKRANARLSQASSVARDGVRVVILPPEVHGSAGGGAALSLVRLRF